MDLRLIILFFVMLVVLVLLLFQAKARVIMAEARSGPFPSAKKRRYYLLALLLWVIIAVGVMAFALSKIRS